MIRHTHDKAAIVDTTVHWIDLNRTKPPGGAKVLLIDRRLGVATQGTWSPTTHWTHWAPLPTFPREGEADEA